MTRPFATARPGLTIAVNQSRAIFPRHRALIRRGGPIPRAPVLLHKKVIFNDSYAYELKLAVSRLDLIDGDHGCGFFLLQN